MSDQIINYLDETSTQEQSDVLKEAISLLDFYEYDAALEELTIVINESDDKDSTDVRDRFTIKLNEFLDVLLSAQHIKLTEDTKMSVKISILRGLASFQNLEDFSEVLTIMESEQMPEEKLSNILATYNDEDKYTIFASIEEVDSRLFEAMLIVIGQVKGMGSSSEEVIDPDVVKRIKDIRAVFGDLPIGVSMLEAKVISNLDLKDYIEMVKSTLDESEIQDKALHVYSLIALNNESSKDVLASYRSVSELLFDNLHDMARCETLLISIMSSISEYRTVNKASLTNSVA